MQILIARARGPIILEPYKSISKSYQSHLCQWPGRESPLTFFFQSLNLFLPLLHLGPYLRCSTYVRQESIYTYGIINSCICRCNMCAYRHRIICIDTTCPKSRFVFVNSPVMYHLLKKYKKNSSSFNSHTCRIPRCSIVCLRSPFSLFPSLTPRPRLS